MKEVIGLDYGRRGHCMERTDTMPLPFSDVMRCHVPEKWRKPDISHRTAQLTKKKNVRVSATAVLLCTVERISAPKLRNLHSKSH